jgi:uncharacterized protein with LGFP repeats
MNSHNRSGILGVFALLFAASASEGWAQGATSAPSDPAPLPMLACGFKIGAPALAEWLNLGGRDGRLGCPTADEAVAVPSFSGAQSREIVFGDTGAIFTYLSGPHSGTAVAIADCYRLYFQYGGATGWLGLPLKDAENTPDGQKQAYEGGEMRLGRALNSCEAERPD